MTHFSSLDLVEAGAPRAEIEITPEMIEAGVDVYYENSGWGWENPGNNELRKMVSEIFKAMSIRAKTKSSRKKSKSQRKESE